MCDPADIGVADMMEEWVVRARGRTGSMLHPPPYMEKEVAFK